LLGLSGNRRLSSPPQEVVAQGVEAVLAFLRALGESAVERWRSKVLIVGEATVGKTRWPSSCSMRRSTLTSGRPTACGSVPCPCPTRTGRGSRWTWTCGTSAGSWSTGPLSGFT
jgi:hypothetical protein